MPLEPFNTSQAFSLGVELELQLISFSDYDLTSASPDLLELLERKKFPGQVTPEITQSMIEISTGIHHDFESLLKQLYEIRDTLVNAGKKLNVGICGGGTHPFQLWTKQKIFSRPRFKQVSQLYGYLAQQFTVFGQHVHVGCANGDDALFLLHALNRYVPHFIALSASSPFILGNDTLFNSSRLNSVYSFPLSGRAPFILKWSEFSDDYFQKIERTGFVKSMKDFYWDIRPKPEFGTIELRVCDTPLSVEQAASLACYLQALCKYLLERNEEAPSEDDYLVYNYNRFLACRFGLDSTLVHPKTYEPLPLREDIVTTLARLEPYMHASALKKLNEVTVSGNDATFLRQAFTKSSSVEGMVDAALQRFTEQHSWIFTA